MYYLAVGDSFSSHVTGTSCTVNHGLDCNSRKFNVVYLINCKVCGLQYVNFIKQYVKHKRKQDTV